MIAFSCPHCGKHLKVHDGYAGQTGTCKGCGESIQAPAAPPPAEVAPPPPSPQFQEPPPQAQDAGVVPDAGVPASGEQARNPWAQLEDIQIGAGAPPPVPVAIEGGHGGGASDNYAGFWLRLVACIIDGVIVGIPVAVAGFVLGLLMGGSMAGPAQTPNDMFVSSMVSNAPALLIGWLYFALCESCSWQATLGKKILGLRVTTLDGDRVSFLRVSGRHFGKIISFMICFMGYTMAGFTPKKQALHDMIAGCLVVRG